MKPTNSIIHFILLATSLSLHAQIQQIQAPSKAVQYNKLEIDVHLKAVWDCPYVASDVTLDMLITAPSGKQLDLPCFYVSGQSNDISQWKARFTPREPGCYFYQFCLTEKGKITNKSDLRQLSVTASDKKGFLNPNNLWSFQYDNGDRFRGIGENIGWEARDNDDSKYFKKLHENPRFNYHDMLTTLKAGGGNFFRTWMIYWNLPVDWKQVQNSRRYQNSDSRFNESGIKRMDALVELCDSLGLHMMLTLDSHAGYLGGGWERNNYNVKNGGTAETALVFFTDDMVKSMYKDKLRFMIARWGYSPSIAAWEFFNEVDNAMYNRPEVERIPDKVITDWHAEMSAYLKKHDPYHHLITTSISHRDVAGMNDIPTLDINQKHIYKHTQDIPKTLQQYTAAYNKPYIIGEFGFEWDWQINFNDIAEGMDSDFKRGLWYGLFSPTPVLPMTWWWEFFDERGLTVYFQHVKDMNAHMMQAGQGDFKSVKVKTLNDTVDALAVQCGTMVFIYIWNPNEEDIETNIAFESIDQRADISKYNCETGCYSTTNFKMGSKQIQTISLAAKTDEILIFNLIEQQ